MKTIVALFALAFTLAACPHPMPVSDPIAHVVDCTQRSIGSQLIGLIPAVNTCLVSLVTLSPTPCLLALIDPARHIGEDDLACLVRSRGAEFAAAGRANPADRTSNHAADAARVFMNERRIMFSD